jgi:hypothetical protein
MFYFQVRYSPEFNLTPVFNLNLEFILSLQELASNKQETLKVIQLFLK